MAFSSKKFKLKSFCARHRIKNSFILKRILQDKIEFERYNLVTWICNLWKRNINTASVPYVPIGIKQLKKNLFLSFCTNKHATKSLHFNLLKNTKSKTEEKGKKEHSKKILSNVGRYGLCCCKLLPYSVRLYNAVSRQIAMAKPTNDQPTWQKAAEKRS